MDWLKKLSKIMIVTLIIIAISPFIIISSFASDWRYLYRKIK